MYSDESDLEEVSAVLKGSSILDEVFEQMAIDFFISFLFFSKRCVQILIIDITRTIQVYIKYWKK